MFTLNKIYLIFFFVHHYSLILEWHLWTKYKSFGFGFVLNLCEDFLELYLESQSWSITVVPDKKAHLRGRKIIIVQML